MQENIKSKIVVLQELGLPINYDCRILWLPLVTTPQDNLLITRHAQTQGKNKITPCALELLLLWENSLKEKFLKEIEEFRLSSVAERSPEELEEEVQQILKRLALITEVQKKQKDNEK